MFFSNANHEILHLNNIIDVLYEFAQEDPYAEYDMIIGTDSQRHKKIITNATVVFLWNLGTRKFRLFYSKDKYNCKSGNDIIGRLIQEANKSIIVAQLIEQSKLSEIISKSNYEIHLDVGYHGKSTKVLDTCVGMVKGSGYNYKIKPDAWLASCVADRFVK